MARPKIEGTDYKVSIHKNGSYMYACTQPRLTNDEGKTYSRRIHWGTVDDRKVFHPNSRYLYADSSERGRLVFPPDWDISEAKRLTERHGRGRVASDEAYENRLYGDVWLLEKIAEETGLKEDLLSTFDDNRTIVDDILTIAMYLVTTGHSCNRIARWQDIEKAPSSSTLTPVAVTRLMQSITEENRMTLMGLRGRRLKKDELCAVDTTSRSAYGDSLADIRWGKNKEGLALPQTDEMVVYGLESHMPVYYRQFPGNMPDSRTVDTMLADLDDAGFGLIPIITDRGYESIANIEKLIARGQPFISAMKTSSALVYDKIKSLGDFCGRPEGMEIDREGGVYMRQFEIDYPVTASNGRRVDSDRLRLNLYFNPIYHGEHLVNLEITVLEQNDLLAQCVSEGRAISDPASLKRQCNYFIIEFDTDSKVKSFSKDNNKIKKSQQLAGFFAILSHKLDWDALQVKEAYGRRDEQEKYYEQMKTMLGNNRQRNWSEDGKLGSQFILFVGLTLSSFLRYKWKSTPLKKMFSSTLEILDEMRSIRCIQHKGHHPRMTPFVGKQRDICEILGLDIPAGCGIEYRSRKVKDKKRGRPAKPKIVKLD